MMIIMVHNMDFDLSLCITQTEFAISRLVPDNYYSFEGFAQCNWLL